MELDDDGMAESVGGGIPNGMGLNVPVRYALCARTGLTYGNVGCTRGLGTAGTLLVGMLGTLDGRVYATVFVTFERLSDVMTGLIFSNDGKPTLV